MESDLLFSDNPGQNSWHTNMKSDIFGKMRNTKLHEGLYPYPSPRINVDFFFCHQYMTKYVLNTKPSGATLIGGKGGTKFKMYVQNPQVCQEFCPRLSELHFFFLMVILSLNSVVFLCHGCIYYCTCICEGIYLSDIFLPFCIRTSPKLKIPNFATSLHFLAENALFTQF